MRDLEAQIAEAELLSSQSESSAPDLDTTLDHSVAFLSNCAEIWNGGNSELRTRFQNLVFPEGLSYRSESGFGTAVTMRIFSDLQSLTEGELQVVPPGGGVWNRISDEIGEISSLLGSFST